MYSKTVRTRYNPATWMLECIGAGVGHGSQNSMDFVDYFKNSPYNQLLETNMAKEGITTPSPDLPEVMFGKKCAASSMTQMKFVVGGFSRCTGVHRATV
ncbi:hypothetical protein PF005_g32676 [Phytophthora fragariae]|uniref:Uncharacterized protein n=1 Tax=Phytophthora fragariae TaxID=53985 RepID=A0A6A3UZ37_9STRA|nr:hypothetical protein PF003_g11297 [Phytophthora fragariae]KAE8917366.1 hypothetical protein PF009_g32312 [Phytophthora fragariae]KAE8955628.1 hypothetical protein PF011_g31737 [Phytophthora fragariae]KAE9055801.1 hypothetical protein PF010_g32014 [Phytophthora fragariae]KAE9056772.1 hypothetical protein PF007_g31878 [Phytophthora fragariae]